LIQGKDTSDDEEQKRKIQQVCSYRLKNLEVYSGLQENIFHGKEFQFYKISSYKGFTSNQTPHGWACYHLRIVISNPRRNVEVIKCKQSTSCYPPRCNKSVQVCIL